NRIESVNPTISKIADQEVTRKTAKGGRRYRHAPWRIQSSLRGETAKQVAVQVELINKSVSLPSNIIVSRCVLQRVSDVQYTGRPCGNDVLDIEWRVAHWARWR